ncbi:MAG: FkbM family methyltransferase [Bdellovibrionota bacterium]
MDISNKYKKINFKEVIIFIIARFRNKILIRTLAKMAAAFTKGYENYSFNPLLNGELRVIKVLSNFNPDLIFDVGANHGHWTSTAQKILPQTQFHCFELSEDTFSILKKNLMGKKNIYLNSFGLSEKTEDIEFNYAIGHDTHSSICTTAISGDYERRKARVVAGHEYAKKFNLESIFFLKIDVEGGEHLVLKGFEEMIRKQRIVMIQFEYGKTNINTKFFLKDFYEILEKNGYKIGKIYPSYVDFKQYKNLNEDFIGPNYLAVLDSHTSLIKQLS